MNADYEIDSFGRELRPAADGERDARTARCDNCHGIFPWTQTVPKLSDPSGRTRLCFACERAIYGRYAKVPQR